jgi:quinoprotein glucose dehydrogenase
MPGTQGGVNYYGGAFDPKLGLFIANVSNLGQPMRIVRNPDGSYINAGPLAGLNRFWDPSNHLPCGPTPWGQLVAVDVNTGKIAWRSTLGVTDSLPEGKQNTGRPGLGGAIITASGLVFIGATDDARFRAFNAKTGKEIWTVKLPAAAESTPITYADAKGKQYVAVVATGGGLIGAPLLSDSLVVYTLAGPNETTSSMEKSIPKAVPETPLVKPAPVAAVGLSSQPAVADADMLPAGVGRETMLRVCSGCHAPTVVTSQRLSPQEWNDLVQVMVGKGAIGTDADFDQISGYLAKSFPSQSSQKAHPQP